MLSGPGAAAVAAPVMLHTVHCGMLCLKKEDSLCRYRHRKTPFAPQFSVSGLCPAEMVFPGARFEMVFHDAQIDSGIEAAEVLDFHGPAR